MTDKTTQNTYNHSAQIFSDYFATVGSRIWDIDKGISFLKPRIQINVFEIGCGDGRDGAEIAKRSKKYLGIDYSEGMIAIARQNHPKLNCIVGDMVNYEYPKNVDIIFSFASILHLDKDELIKVLDKCKNSLKANGIIYISSKYKPEFCSESKQDHAGMRRFYYYNPDIILKLASNKFTELHRDLQSKGGTKWFVQILKKN
jgi:SAM-dependent methyltransferase